MSSSLILGVQILYLIATPETNHAALRRNIYLANKNLRVIPDYIQHTTYNNSTFIVYLMRNKIAAVNRTSFSHLHNLQELHLDSNELENIADFAFEHLVNLLKLDLAENQLKQITNATFFGLWKLRELHLESNQLENITDFVFERLVNLLKLNLAENRLKQITNATFFGLWKLKQLFLTGNRIKVIGKDSFIHAQDFHLSLSNNYINFIRIGMFERVQVHDLMIESCHLIEIQIYAFKNLPRLITLNMKSNKLELIKTGMFYDLGNLQNLDLSENRIRSLEVDSFKGMPRLKNISLLKNNLKIIDPRIFERNHLFFSHYPKMQLTLNIIPNSQFQWTECNCWLRKAVARKQVIEPKQSCVKNLFWCQPFLRKCNRMEAENELVCGIPVCYPQCNATTTESPAPSSSFPTAIKR